MNETDKQRQRQQHVAPSHDCPPIHALINYARQSENTTAVIDLRTRILRILINCQNSRIFTNTKMPTTFKNVIIKIIITMCKSLLQTQVY